MPFLLDKSHHSDTKTVVDIMLGGIIACSEDGVWDFLWPPEPGRERIGHSVIIDADNNVMFGNMMVQISSDLNNPKLLGEVFGKTIVSIIQTDDNTTTYKIGLKGDIPGGTTNNPASIQVGRYGTNSEGKYGWWPLYDEDSIPSHHLLQPPAESGLHSDTINYPQPSAGDMILGKDSEQWGKLSIGSSGYLIYDSQDVKWADFETDPQDLIVWNNGAYALKNDQNNPQNNSFYGAIVSNNSVNIGWHEKQASDGKCGGDGSDDGTGKAACCPKSIEIVKVTKSEDSRTIRLTLRLVFTNNVAIRGGDQCTIKGTYSHPSTGERNFESQTKSVAGNSVEFEVVLPDSTNDTRETVITVKGVSDELKCIAPNGKTVNVNTFFKEGNEDCYKNISIKIGHRTGGGGGDDPTGRPCDDFAYITRWYSYVRNGTVVGLVIGLDRTAHVVGTLTSVNGKVVNGVILFSHTEGNCVVGASGETQSPFPIIKGEVNELCFDVFVYCCSRDPNRHPVTHRRCVKMYVDDHGNGGVDIDLPSPPNEPPPPAPTGDCGERPNLLCVRVAYDGGTVFGMFEASRLVTGFSDGVITISKAQTGEQVARIPATTMVFSNQVASRNIIVIGMQNIMLENGTYNVCVTAGPMLCWDNQNFASDPATCCVAMDVNNGKGAGGPGMNPGEGGGGGGQGGGGNPGQPIPEGGGVINVPNFNPGEAGTLTISAGCTTITLNANRRYAIFNAQGQCTVVVVIPWVFEFPKSVEDLPAGTREMVKNSQIAFSVHSVTMKRKGGGVNLFDGIPIGQIFPTGSKVYALTTNFDSQTTAFATMGTPFENIGNNVQGIGVGVNNQPVRVAHKASFALSVPPEYQILPETDEAIVISPASQEPKYPEHLPAAPVFFSHIYGGSLGSIVCTQRRTIAHMPDFPSICGMHNYARMRHVVWVSRGNNVEGSKDIWTTVRENNETRNWNCNITFKICFFYF